MMAVARACVSFALLALVAVGFSLTVKVCGASDARAGEPARVAEYGLPIYRSTDDAAASETETTSPSEGEVGSRADRSAPNLPVAMPASNGADGDGGERVGNVELHNMAVWDSPDGSPNVFVSFTPISHEHIDGDVPFRSEMLDGEEVEVADVAPELDESDVRIEVDGDAADVTSLVWYYAGYGDLGGADVKYMPVCLIGVARPELSGGEHELRVMILDADSGTHGEKAATFQCGTAQL